MYVSDYQNIKNIIALTNFMLLLLREDNDTIGSTNSGEQDGAVLVDSKGGIGRSDTSKVRKRIPQSQGDDRRCVLMLYADARYLKMEVHCPVSVCC